MLWQLPNGVQVAELTKHADERGSLTELFRQEWVPDLQVLQWNFVRTQKNVLRGVHVHLVHYDYLILLEGTAVFALKDMRRKSPTFGMSSLIEVSGANLQAVIIPPGVAHGFYYYEPSLHIYAVSHYWSKDDELGCMWNDPNLNFSWPASNPLISPRDAALPTFDELLASLPEMTVSR